MGEPSTSSSATTSAEDFADREWQSRRITARLLRVAMVVGPLLTSVGAARLFGAAVARPAAWTPRIVWFGVVLVLSWGCYRIADSWFRRLTPLASLLNMRLVFPDQAPSRFKAALRSQSARDLERRLDDPDVADDLPLPGDHARELVGLIGQLSDHDRMTRGHSERVRAYSDVIGEQMGLSQDELNKLHWGALLHDVGKLFVDPEVLNSPGRPTEEGWQQIRGHPGHSQSLMRGIADWLGPSIGAATEHHERYDGGGYPAGLAGQEISLAGRIVCVADAYDVMTSARSYKKALSHEAARAELTRNAGTQFDPAVVRVFLEAGLGRHRRLPGVLGSLAELPSVLSNVGSSVTTVATTAVAAVAVAVAPPAVEPPPLQVEGLAMQVSDSATTVVEPGAPVTVAEAVTNSAARTGDAPADTVESEPTTTLESTTTTTTAPATPVTTTTTAPATTAPPTPVATTAPATTASKANAVGDSGSTSNQILISVLANDSFSNGYQLGSLQIVVSPTLGAAAALAINNPATAKILYTAGTPGVDSFTYRVCDSGGDCDTATVTVTVS